MKGKLGRTASECEKERKQPPKGGTWKGFQKDRFRIESHAKEEGDDGPGAAGGSALGTSWQGLSPRQWLDWVPAGQAFACPLGFKRLCLLPVSWKLTRLDLLCFQGVGR